MKAPRVLMPRLGGGTEAILVVALVVACIVEKMGNDRP